MKKLIATCLAAALTLMLAACGSTTPAGEAPGDGTVNLTFWHSMSDDAGVLLEQLVQEFNETTGAEKKIAVTAVYQGRYSDATTKLKAVLTANDPRQLPDVMQMDATAKILYAQSGVAYTYDGILADHPDFATESLHESLVNNWTFQNVRLGVPFAASTTVMYYNKTLLDSVGAAAPETLADIAALQPLLDGQVGDIFTCLPNSASLNNWVQQLGGKLLDMDNGTLGNATALVSAADGTLATFLNEWKALYASGALRSADTTTTDAFVAGETALFTGSTSSLHGVMNKVGDRFEVGVAYFPRVNEAATFGTTSSGSALMAFDKGDAAKKGAAWEFMQFMISAETQSAWCQGTGYLPVNTGTAETGSYQAFIEALPQFDVGVQQLQAASGFTSVTVGPAADLYYAVQNNISEMLEGDLPVEETIANMTEEMEGMLAEYARANP